MSKIYFSEIFDVSKESLDDYGAFNISLVTDLPLFIDPFLLFNSDKPEYKKLHGEIIDYLRFLKKKSASGEKMSVGSLMNWYIFSEVKQNWFGYSQAGNSGRGLANEFAKSLNENLHIVFTDFSEETITKGSHLEKLCLIREGVGKDNISDFVTNLIKDYLLTYTENFAKENIPVEMRKDIYVKKALFNYETESWQTKKYNLPFYNNDYVLLTPKDLLTKEDIWINKDDLVDDFEQLPYAVSNQELRAEINNYFNQQLSKKPSKKERSAAAQKTLIKYPELIDYYIKSKEENGDSAVSISSEYVKESEDYYIENISTLIDILQSKTQFYSIEESDSYKEAIRRGMYFKDVIENKDGYKSFYVNGQPIKRETDDQIGYRLVWYGTKYDVNREPNNGRGPADFTVSMGSNNKTVVEMKLASNSKLRQNLEKQAEIYAKANNTEKIVKIIIFFTEDEQKKVLTILNELGLSGKENVILIDARNDNKPSASNVK